MTGDDTTGAPTTADPTTTPDYRSRRALEILAEDPAVIANGIKPAEMTDEMAVMTMVVRPDQANSHDICHGGVLVMLADTTTAYAANTAEKTSLWVTSTMSVHFLRPAKVGQELRATCRPAWDGGGRTRLYDTVIEDPDGVQVLAVRAQMTRLRTPV